MLRGWIGYGVPDQVPAQLLYIRFLPTKADFKHWVKRIEKNYRQEISELKKGHGVHIEDIENTTDGLCNALQSHEEILNTHTVMLQQLSYKQDDIENRNRCNNIRICGLPEPVEPKDLSMAVTAIFNQLLKKPKENPIELDRVHRTSGPCNPNPFFVRDTLCRVHFYEVKEAIMRAASTQDTTLYKNTPVMLLPDLSHQTLAMRKALKPLT